jgi:phage/plasmid-associated DNA primase
VVLEETAALFEAMDPLADFLDEECVLHPRALVETGALWRAYLQWCDQDARSPGVRTKRWLTRSLAQRDGIELIRRHDGRYLIGLGLRSEQAGLGLEAGFTSEQAPS